MPMEDIRVSASTVIQAPASAVWEYLTDPGRMNQWMGEPEMGVEVATEWEVGGPIRISGFHHIAFENTGTVLRFEPGKILRYTHRSSLSHLPDTPENHSIITFRLSGKEGGTALEVTVENFPTETIHKHLAFYWRSTLPLLKRVVEGR